MLTACISLLYFLPTLLPFYLEPVHHFNLHYSLNPLRTLFIYLCTSSSYGSLWACWETIDLFINQFSLEGNSASVFGHFFYLLRKLMLFKLSCYLTPVKALKCASSAITCASFMPKAVAKPECFSDQSRLWMTVTRKPPGRNWLRSACSYSCRWQTGLFNCSRKVDPEQGGASCQHPSQRSE